MSRRYFSSVAVETTLASSASNSATSITVTALSGFPNTTPWTAILDADTASEEVVSVTAVAGTTLTVTRGVDGTSGVAHNAGASFKHGVSARDFDEANSHVNASSGVHGLTGSVVGSSDSQTLTNKTIAIADNTLTGVAPTSNPTFTGQVIVPAGSASAPAIAPTGDTNTGIYSAGADSLSLATGGTERVRVSSTGNVSIATTSQISRLQVSSGSSGVSSFIAGVEGATIENDDNVGLMFASPNTVSAYIFFADPESGQAGRIQYSHVNEFLAMSLQGTERFRLDSNGLITGSGSSLGAWTSYTPTLGGTGWALGDGTATGAWCQIGKVIFFRAQIVFGSTSTYGAVVPTITGPANVRASISGNHDIQVNLLDTSLGSEYVAWTRTASSLPLTLNISYLGTNSLRTDVTSTAPFTWANGDRIQVTGFVEAA